MRFNSSVVNNFVIVYGEKKKHVNIIINFTNYLVGNGSFFYFCKVVGCLSIKENRPQYQENCLVNYKWEDILK